jgi:hypothetical protein
MQWHQILKQGHLQVDGKRYDLTHLLGSVVEFTIPPSDRYPRLAVSMRVEYTSHCVSYGPPANGKPFDFTSLGPARRIHDHRGIERVFCFERYRHSLQLPQVISKLDAHTCYFTGRENWLVIEHIDERGRRSEYEVFFRLRRGEAPHTLRLVVESAYVRDTDRSRPGIPRNRRGRIKFAVMAAKILRGEPIRDPGRNR